MTVHRILVVDDDPTDLKVVTDVLTDDGYQVHAARDLSTAREVFDGLGPSLVVLEVALKGGSGLDLARDLRAVSDVPIIILSARDSEVDRVLGLEFGADDYVAKPFSPREFVSRVRAILRRAESCAEGKSAVEVDGLTIDMKARQVRMAGTEVTLTRTEYDILAFLARHPGQAFTREEIAAAVSASSYGGDPRTVDVHVHNLREKLEPVPAEPSYILTVRGFGYRLREA